MNNNCIGVFDSGIGGATVMKEILKVLPHENYIYYSDSANNPYGDKTNDEIINICDDIVKKLLEKGCKAIVIACNTASARAVNFLRAKYSDIPIIAIEPAYKMIYDMAYDGNALVMATKGTIESERFQMIYKKYDNHKTTLIECVGLAELIENGTDLQIDKYIKDNLTQYKGKINNVVLGCTHYPLIKDKIASVLGEVNFFDGAQGLAKHLKEVLTQNNLLNSDKRNAKIEFIDSSNIEKKRNRFFSFVTVHS